MIMYFRDDKNYIIRGFIKKLKPWVLEKSFLSFFFSKICNFSNMSCNNALKFAKNCGYLQKARVPKHPGTHTKVGPEYSLRHTQNLFWQTQGCKWVTLKCKGIR